MDQFEGEQFLGQRPDEQALGWYLSLIARGVRGDPLVDLESEVRDRLPWFASPGSYAGFVRSRVESYAPGFRLVDVERVTDHMVVGIVETSRDEVWRAVAASDPGTGERQFVASAQAPPSEVVLRDADTEDGRAIAELMRRTPIRTGDDETLLDYGDDYLRASAMGDDPVTVVAVWEGQVVGVHGTVAVGVERDGRVRSTRYIRHTRVDPVTRGLGVFSSLNGALFEGALRRWTGDEDELLPFSLIALGNDRMLELFPESMRAWGTPWTRLHLDTGRLAGTPVDRAVEAATDLGGVADLVQAGRGEVAAAVPVDADQLRRRLDSRPWLYGPDQLRSNGAAVVGVGRSTIDVLRSDGDATREAVVYDIGMEPGAESALLELLGHWGSELSAAGVDRLVVGCPAASPVAAAVGDSTEERELYLLTSQWPAPDASRTPSFGFDNALM